MKITTSKRGFTLIELMIVVAIIGILAAIAIPQFANMVAKSQEGATKGNLGTIRSSLSIYYGDTEGWYPLDAAGLGSLTTSSKYLQTVPNATLPKTNSNSGHVTTSAIVNTAAGPGDVGGWWYNNTQSATNWGQIVVSCTHNDLRNTIWTSY